MGSDERGHQMCEIVIEPSKGFMRYDARVFRAVYEQYGHDRASDVMHAIDRMFWLNGETGVVADLLVEIVYQIQEDIICPSL